MLLPIVCQGLELELELELEVAFERELLGCVIFVLSQVSFLCNCTDVLSILLLFVIWRT